MLIFSNAIYLVKILSHTLIAMLSTYRYTGTMPDACFQVPILDLLVLA